MSQASKEKVRWFEQKMHDEGAAGFADGPRPWEHWDESGNQESNRVWEGSAKRLNGKHKKHSFGYRLLSLLALIALTALLVGIGGVYYTHSQHIAQTGEQPLPVTRRPGPVIPSPGSDVVVMAAPETDDLNILTAPAAGTGKDHDEPIVEVTMAEGEVASLIDQSTTETATSDNEATDEPGVVATTVDAPETAGLAAVTVIPTVVASKTPPLVTNEDISSVAIETIVTEQSITTTVYTRQPRQDKPNIVAAIETTPPPFAHELAQPVTAEAEPAEEATDHGSMATPAVATSTLPQTDELEITAPEASETVEDPVAAPAEDGQADRLAPDRPVAGTGDTTTGVAAGQDDVASAAEPVAEVEPEPVEEERIASVEPVAPIAKSGNWVINLASYTWKSTANRKLALFGQQGVDAEVFEVLINNKPMYRIRVVGFENSRAAKAEIPALEQTLDLEGAWISTR